MFRLDGEPEVGVTLVGTPSRVVGPLTPVPSTEPGSGERRLRRL